MSITEEVDKDISEALNDDAEYLKLTPAERVEVLNRLNGMLHHTLYDAPPKGTPTVGVGRIEDGE